MRCQYASSEQREEIDFLCPGRAHIRARRATEKLEGEISAGEEDDDLNKPLAQQARWTR